MIDIKIHCAHTEVVDPATLVPNPRNPNQHPKKQIELYARLIQHQGWRRPITISSRSGYVVRGHGALEAALLLGCMVPVDRQDYATEADEWADLVADNRLAELSEIDDTLLAQLLAEIGATELDVSLTGYSDFTTFMAGIVRELLEEYDDQGQPKACELVLPDDNELIAQLTSRKYEVYESTGKIKIESKKEMKKRKLPSPDRADCLFLLCLPVKIKGHNAAERQHAY